MKNIFYLYLTYFLQYAIAATTAKSNYESTSAFKYRSDYQYVKEIDAYVKFHEIPITWHQAYLTCGLEGAKLVSPLNEEMSKVFQKFSETSRRFFTGFYSYGYGFFSSIEGILLSQIPHLWETGPQPDNKDGEEYCIAYQNGLLSDVKCGETYPYICYRPANMTELNECGTVNNGYNYSNVTGRCYKFHSYREDWRSAIRTCLAEDGHLLVINSNEEAAVMHKMLRTHDGWSDNNAYHCGIRDLSGRGLWITIFGDSLQSTGYKIPEPDSYPDSLRCGAIDRSINVKKSHCDTILPFICEKNALYTAPSS